MAPVTPASNAGERYWEGERGGVMTGGVGLSERERGVRSWAGSGVSWAGWFPGSAQLGLWPLFFFLLFPLFLFFI
jgi:hypothetical protein